MKFAELSACSIPSLARPARRNSRAATRLRDVVRDELRILDRGFGSQRGEHVDAVGRLGFVQILNVGRLREQAADPHRRHPVDFGECPADEQVVIVLDQRQNGRAAELVVGFVDQNGGLRGALEDLSDLGDSGRSAGGIVRIGDQDGARRGSDWNRATGRAGKRVFAGRSRSL